MSADTITDAVVAWFGPPNVIGLNTLHDTAPLFDGGPAWNLADQAGWGAVGYIHIERQIEHRIAMGGPHGGMKQVGYDVGIAIQFQWLVPSGFDPAADGTGFRRPLNQLLDGIRARLRQDRTLGRGGPEIGPDGIILQAGEGDGSGAPDIVVERDLPRRDSNGGKVWSWNLVQFHVVEIVVS